MTLAEVQADIASALETLMLEVPELQVYAGLNPTPTPPSLDVFPASPSQLGAGFGLQAKRVWFVVRARVSTADTAGQDLLLRMLDPGDALNVEAALDREGAASIGNEEEIGGLQTYPDGLLGCEWRVTAYL